MKNLKMFAIGLAAFAAMTMGVHAACNTTAEWTKPDGTVTCEATLTAAVTNADAGSVITLLQDTQEGNINVTKDITVNLNEHKVTAANGDIFRVAAGAKLTLNGKGELYNAGSTASQADVTVAAGGSFETKGAVTLTQESTNATVEAVRVIGSADASVKTNVTFSDETVVTSKLNGIVIYQDTFTGNNSGTAGAALGVTVNMAGTWNVQKYAVKVNGSIAYAADGATVINIEKGTYTGVNNALYASGYAIWNIKGGEFTGAQALQINSGKVTISGGKFVANGPAATGVPANRKNTGSAIVVYNAHEDIAGYPDAKYIDLTITDGEFISEKANAINIDRARDGKFAINGGSFTSGKDSEGNCLPAIYIFDYAFVSSHEGMITGGTFACSVVGDTDNSSSSYQPAENVLAILTKGSNVKTEGGKVVVGDPATSEEPGQTEPTVPGDEEQNGDTNVGDSANNQQPAENVEPAKTGDNIVTFMGLGLASLAVVGLGAKNLKKQTSM